MWFLAGDDAQAYASVSAFIKGLGLRPQGTGDVSMAHWLDGAGLLSVDLGRFGVGNVNFSLCVSFGWARRRIRHAAPSRLAGSRLRRAVALRWGWRCR